MSDVIRETLANAISDAVISQLPWSTAVADAVIAAIDARIAASKAYYGHTDSLLPLVPPKGTEPRQ